MKEEIIEHRDENGKLIRRQVIQHTEGPSMAVQSEKDRCDINKIMQKYRYTGLIDHVKAGGDYGDFSAIGDYKGAMDQVIKAQEAFMTLDSSLRAHFGNDPAKLLEFLGDKKNEKKAIELGLVDYKGSNVEKADLKAKADAEKAALAAQNASQAEKKA
jgi:phage internal scaffolding protein